MVQSAKMDKAEARQRIANLVAHWRSLTPSQIHQDYQEANTRKDFIRPLFDALGWNTALADEVFEEHRAANGAVDYAFRIRGVSRFYLEAKALRAELSSNSEWVKQAVTYAYSRGVPWVVLTNFKELWAFGGDVRAQRFLTLSAERYV
jgi:predicted type IV restriction endonuclease